MTAWDSWDAYRKDEEWITELPGGGDLPWALFYPADYSIGAANLGYHYIFETLKKAGVMTERFFASPVPYRSADKDTLLERFSVITASIAYEGSIPLFCRWLSEASIPLLPEQRAAASFPVVGMGGALSYINPLSVAGICDFIILGDGMDIMPHVIAALREHERTGDRQKLWERLAEADEILVPPVDIIDGKIIRKLKVGRTLSLDGPYPMHSLWTTPRAAFGKSLLLELQRGCARNCSYCTLPGCFGKMRFRSFELLKEAVEKITSRFEIPQAGLVTPEAGDYPMLPQLTELLGEKKVGVSFASLRLDRLTPQMIEAMTANGRKSITVAPETGGEALRFACGKKFTDDLILEKLSLAKTMGIERVKLYFMIGLPGETDEDITAMTALCRRVIAETGQNLTLSVNPFIPKPGTPWRNELFAGKKTIKQKYEKIKKEMRSITRKTPQLRLTGIKEAETEFALSWYGYNESRALALSAAEGRLILPEPDRNAAAQELAKIG